MSEPRAISLPHGIATVTSFGAVELPRIVVVPPLGMPASVLGAFAKALAAELHVCVVELPGAGHASRAGWMTTTRALGESLAVLMAQLGPGRAHLFGVSFGGMIAQWTAIDAPEGIDRLVLASTASYGRDVMIAEPLTKLQVGSHLFDPEPVRVALAEGVVSDEISGSPSRHRRLARQIRSAPRVAFELLWLGVAVARHDTRSHLGAIACPTLVLTGRNDHLVPSRLQDELAAGVPKSTRAFVADAGHAVMIDRPEESARIVLRFLRGEVSTSD